MDVVESRKVYKSYKDVFPESRKDEIMIALNELKHYIKILKCSKLHKSSRIFSEKMIEELKNKSLEYERQLISTEQKCRELEHRIGDLNHMKPPNSATSQKRDVIYKDCGFNNISKTDLDNLKLTLAHNIAKKKILELEEKLKDDSNRDDTISNDIYLNKTIKSKKIKRKTTRKRNEMVDMMNNGSGYNDDAEYASHSVVHDKPHDPNVKIKNSSNEYKLDFTEIPFIAGKSTGKSHSLTANFQEVLSLMKFNNLKICGKTINTSCHRSCDCYKNNTNSPPNSSIHQSCHYKSPVRSSVRKPNAHVNVPNDTQALDDEISSTVLVSQLTSEIMHLKLKRNKLVQLIWVASSSEASKKDAELQIKHVEKEIEDKYNQISQIQTQGSHKIPTKSATIRREPGSFKLEIMDTIPVPSNKADKFLHPNVTRPKNTDLLKNLKCIQNSLRNN